MFKGRVPSNLGKDYDVVVLSSMQSSSVISDAAMQPSGSSNAVSRDTSVIDGLDSNNSPTLLSIMLLVVVRLQIPADGKISENG